MNRGTFDMDFSPWQPRHMNSSEKQIDGLITRYEPTDTVIAWYDPTEWDAWRAACEDGERFFSEAFALWVARALTAIEDQQRKGVRLFPHLIRLADFLQWAHEQG